MEHDHQSNKRTRQNEHHNTIRHRKVRTPRPRDLYLDAKSGRHHLLVRNDKSEHLWGSKAVDSGCTPHDSQSLLWARGRRSLSRTQGQLSDTSPDTLGQMGLWIRGWRSLGAGHPRTPGAIRGKGAPSDQSRPGRRHRSGLRSLSGGTGTTANSGRICRKSPRPSRRSVGRLEEPTKRLRTTSTTLKNPPKTGARQPLLVGFLL